jgi:hypothetical protein
MQLKPALRTLPAARHSLQQRATLRAPRHRVRSRKIDRPGTERIVPLGRSGSGPFPRSLARLVIAVLISMLPVFRCHKASPPRGPYCLPCTPSAASAE